MPGVFHAALEDGRTALFLFLVHQYFGGMMSEALRKNMLPGETASCYIMENCIGIVFGNRCTEICRLGFWYHYLCSYAV